MFLKAQILTKYPQADLKKDSIVLVDERYNCTDCNYRLNKGELIAIQAYPATPQTVLAARIIAIEGESIKVETNKSDLQFRRPSSQGDSDVVLVPKGQVAIELYDDLEEEPFKIIVDYKNIAGKIELKKKAPLLSGIYNIH